MIELLWMLVFFLIAVGVVYVVFWVLETAGIPLPPKIKNIVLVIMVLIFLIYLLIQFAPAGMR